MTNLGFACRGADGRGISPMAMVSSTAGAEPKPGARGSAIRRRASRQQGGSPRSCRIRPGRRLDIGFLVPASSSVARRHRLCVLTIGLRPASGSSCTSALVSSNAISSSAIWSRLSRASAHAAASWTASSWPIVSSFHISPKLNIGTTMYPKLGSHRAGVQSEIRFYLRDTLCICA